LPGNGFVAVRSVEHKGDTVETVNQFSITGKLGEATETYLAWDGQRDAKVVLRFIDPALAKEPEYLTCLETVTKRLMGLNDRHISEFFSLEESEGKRFAVREYVLGQSVHELSRVNPFDYQAFLNIALQISQGLKEAHEVGITHGRLNGRNVIVTPHGQASIVDFGLHGCYTQKDLANVRMEILPYLAPEQLEQGTCDELSDLYSAGVIFYEMLTGRLPFEGEEPEQLVAAIKGGAPPLGEQVGPELHGDAILLIEKLLAYEPGDRLISARELLNTLKAMTAHQLERRGTANVPESRASARTYLMLSILTALIVIFWLVVTTIHK